MSCGWFILGKCEIQLQVVHVNILLVAAIPNVLLVLCFRWGCSLVGQTIRPACCWCRFDSPGAARDFSPGVNFPCRLSSGVPTHLCAITCINICAYIKDPVVHVKSLVDYGNTKTPSMHRSHSWLSFPGKSPWISHGRNPNGTKQLLKTNLQGLGSGLYLKCRESGGGERNPNGCCTPPLTYG